MGQHKTSIHWERDTEHSNIKSFNRDHVIRFENKARRSGFIANSVRTSISIQPNF